MTSDNCYDVFADGNGVLSYLDVLSGTVLATRKTQIILIVDRLRCLIHKRGGPMMEIMFNLITVLNVKGICESMVEEIKHMIAVCIDLSVMTGAIK